MDGDDSNDPEGSNTPAPVADSSGSSLPKLGRREVTWLQGGPRHARAARPTGGPMYLLTFAAILGAVVSLRSELLAGAAEDSWKQSSRAELIRSSGLVGSADYVLNVAAPEVFTGFEAVFLDRQIRLKSKLGSSQQVRRALINEARSQHDAVARYDETIAGMAKSDAYLLAAVNGSLSRLFV